MNREKLGIYFIASALSIILIALIGMLLLIVINGLGVFWQKQVQHWQLKDGTQILGELHEESLDGEDEEIIKIKIANRDIWGLDYRWIRVKDIATSSKPKEALIIKRLEHGDFFGYFDKEEFKTYEDALAYIDQSLDKIAGIMPEFDAITEKISLLNSEIFRSQNELDEALHHNSDAKNNQTDSLNAKIQQLKNEVDLLNITQSELQTLISSYKLPVTTAQGQRVLIQFDTIIQFLFPNQMGVFNKAGHYIKQFWEFLSTEPREANTEGGVFPAIFGTVILVFLMSILSFPLGVITAIYIKEYAKEGWLVNAVRIAVNNLAGVPSIVYGIFGLGFFVYGIGGSIDKFFFAESLPTPTFGTGGILWASLTLGLLTVPVVIVSTEEALATIPRGIREASYALGANKLQTLIKVTIPMASPGMITGFILSIARATGEVAPLMITGVVKLTNYLPIDGEFPYIHLNRKFMHLGFHIFDVGFQSPNVEVAKSMVYLTTFLLIMIVIFMSSIAIYIRAKMINRYSVQSI